MTNIRNATTHGHIDVEYQGLQRRRALREVRTYNALLVGVFTTCLAEDAAVIGLSRELASEDHWSLLTDFVEAMAGGSSIYLGA